MHPVVSSRAWTTLAVATILALAASPVAGASSPTGCLNISYAAFGQGFYVDYDFHDAVAFIVSSGAPAGGLTFGVVLYPSLCGMSGMIEQAIADTYVAAKHAQGNAPGAPTLPALP